MENYEKTGDIGTLNADISKKDKVGTYIKKVEIEYKIDGKICKTIYENELGIILLDVLEYPENADVTLWGNDDKVYVISFGTLLKLKLGDATGVTSVEREAASILLDGNNYSFVIDQINIIEGKTSFSYTDVTEQILLGFPALSSEIINGVDAGIWSDSGERVLAVRLSGIPFEIEKSNCSLVFFNYDDEEFYDSTYPKADIKEINKEENSDGLIYYCAVDTNDISTKAQTDKEKYTVRGWFAVSNNMRSDRGETKITYEFPISLFFNNSKIFSSKNKYLRVDKNSTVSIDFGTSSTCAAIESNIISMIEMSLDVEGESVYSVYENPTNLMIYNWDEMENWNDNKNKIPTIRRRSSVIPYHYNSGEFDFGHFVKGQGIENQRILESVISQLKMIPQMIEDGEIIKKRDFDNSTEFELDTNLKNDFDMSRRTAFNPIEFYGYLLGKAINHPNGSTNKYYTKYILSYPVKFSKIIREKIEKSLTEGILKSLPYPLRTLKDEKGKKLFKVKMNYSEPVACVGAACREELVIEDDKPCLFGVFDFGGGTADYSFGMYRNADPEIEGYDEALEFFGVDGDDSFGGELIISKISYWILTDSSNKGVILDNGILFEKPKDELIEDGYANLLSSTSGAKANIKILNEAVSRSYFEGTPPTFTYEGDNFAQVNSQTGRFEYSESTAAEVELFSINQQAKVPVKLNINYEMLNQRLLQLFQDKCKAFSKSMVNAFSLSESKKKMEAAGTEYDKSNVQILMSGNSSRHPMVKECLTELFPSNKICLIGEDRNTENESRNRYKVTPKTAVAIGALKLKQMLVIEAVSIVYVAIEKKSVFEIVFNGDLSDMRWQRAGIINDGCFTIYTGTTPDVDNRMLWKNVSLEIDCDDEERMVCWLRQRNGEQIEYIAVPVGTNPNDDVSSYEEVVFVQNI